MQRASQLSRTCSSSKWDRMGITQPFDTFKRRILQEIDISTCAKEIIGSLERGKGMR